MEATINLGRKKEFTDGIKAGVPIFMGYFPIALTFGLIAKTSGIPSLWAVLMSFTSFTGAAQFICVSMYASGAAVANIILTTFIINTRYLLMSFCVANKLKNSVSTKLRALLAFGITDEVFVLSMTREELNTSFMFGTQFIAFIGWVGGTLAGVVLANVLPKSISDSIGIAIYIMFLGLLLPAATKSMKIAIVSIIAMSISSIIYWIPFLNKSLGDWRIIITIILASLIGAAVFPVEGETENE